MRKNVGNRLIERSEITALMPESCCITMSITAMMVILRRNGLTNRSRMETLGSCFICSCSCLISAISSPTSVRFRRRTNAIEKNITKKKYNTRLNQSIDRSIITVVGRSVVALGQVEVLGAFRAERKRQKLHNARNDAQPEENGPAEAISEDVGQAEDLRRPNSDSDKQLMYWSNGSAQTAGRNLGEIHRRNSTVEPWSQNKLYGKRTSKPWLLQLCNPINQSIELINQSINQSIELRLDKTRSHIISGSSVTNRRSSQ